MNTISIVAQREIKSWLFSSVFYAYCLLYSFFALSSMFLLSRFLEANQADLSYAFFRWQPWIFALTAPVIGMRTWSEESQCGVFEVMGTQPISPMHWLLGKSIGGFVIVALALFFTAPAVITVGWLGEPDFGMIVCGYLGSFLCGCAFVAISQAVSASMRVSIGSFVCAVAICLVLVVSGLTQVANIILGTFPTLEWMTQLLSGVSISAKFEPFMQGRIELSSTVGFVLVVIAALCVSHRALLAHRRPSVKTTKRFTNFFSRVDSHQVKANLRDE